MAEGDVTVQARKRGSRRAGKGPTLADVAREAQVSPMTVSRVVNGESNVVAATREVVERAIAKLGYVPNQAARMLAAGRQSRIALLHDNPSAQWLSEVLVACLEQASADGAQLLVERRDDHDRIDRLVSHLVASHVDGVILPPPLGDDPAMLAALLKAGVPLVQIAAGQASPLADSVNVDDRAAALAMTRSLIARGHRHIGFIVGGAGHTSSALRRAGYEAALAEAGIAPDPALVVAGDFSYRSGLAAADALLALPERPSAIFASNDDMAAATIAAAHRKGLDVPGDVSVCGFDDTAIATMIWPPLTTVRQPIGDMARDATELLGEAIRARQAGVERQVRHARLPFELVERDSVADLPPGA